MGIELIIYLASLMFGLLMCVGVFMPEARQSENATPAGLGCAFILGALVVWAAGSRAFYLAFTPAAELQAERDSWAVSRAAEQQDVIVAEIKARAQEQAGQRQRVQDHWNQILSRLSTAYAATGSLRYMKDPSPMSVVTLLNTSSGMAREAKAVAQSAINGDRAVPPAWTPIFESLDVASYCLAAGNDSMIEAVDTGYPSKVAKAQELYGELEDRVVTAIRDGRVLYQQMGGDAQSLPVYGFKP